RAEAGDRLVVPPGAGVIDPREDPAHPAAPPPPAEGIGERRDHRRASGRTISPNRSTVSTGSTARLTLNMSRRAPAARAARTWARQSAGVPHTAKRRAR